MSEILCRAPGCDAPPHGQRKYCAMHRQRLKKFGVLEPYHCIGCGLQLSEGRKFCGDCHRLNVALKSRRSRGKLAGRPGEMERRAATVKQWRQDNPEAWQAIARRRHLKHTYKMTVEQYDEMYAAQGGGCAICGAPDGDPSGRRLHVDHDHTCCAGERSCGKCNRGLLCKACNTGLGGFRDDPAHLEAAIRYLRKP